MNSEEMQESYGPEKELASGGYIHGWPKTEEFARQTAHALHREIYAEKIARLEKKVKETQDQHDAERFDRLGDEIHLTNVAKGFWKEPEMMDKYAAKLALIHSEVTEVLEALRKSQGTDKVTEEFADILIRTFDLYSTLVAAGEADPNLHKVMRDKMETNKNRAPKHGNRWG